MRQSQLIGMIAAAALAIGAVAAHATPSSEITVTSREIQAQAIVGGQLDVLGLDVTIAAPRGDILDALTVQQLGSATWQVDIADARLWADAGAQGFQGEGSDRALGDGTWVAIEHGWVFDRVFAPISAEGTRLFVTISTVAQPTDRAAVQLRIPGYLDAFTPMSYDRGDRGVFLRTARPAPFAPITAPSSHVISRRAADELPPRIRIVDPVDGATLNQNWLLVRGTARDLGGSVPSRVRLGVNRVGRAITWVEATPETAGFATWEARFFELPVPSVLELRVQGEDWVGNRSAVSSPVVVTLTGISN